MKYKLSRLATFIDKYGLYKGIGLYVNFKIKHVSKINIPGITSAFLLRKNTSDIAVFDQVFLLDEYNINFSFDPAVIVDAGANIGLFSIVMKNKFPDAKIICIEPDKDNFEILRRNLGEYSNVKLLYAGVWNRVTKLKVEDKYQEGYSGITVEENEEQGDVPAITIDALMESNRLSHIDVLKIDIETSERELFLKNYEQWLPKVKVIIIELHDWIKEGCSRPFFEAINKSLSNYNCSVHGENIVVENKDWTN